MSNKIMAPALCKVLQPLTQNGIINAQKAGECVRLFMNGDTSILLEIINSKELPVSVMPLVQPLKQFI